MCVSTFNSHSLFTLIPDVSPEISWAQIVSGKIRIGWRGCIKRSLFLHCHLSTWLVLEDVNSESHCLSGCPIKICLKGGIEEKWLREAQPQVAGQARLVRVVLESAWARGFPGRWSLLADTQGLTFHMAGGPCLKRADKQTALLKNREEERLNRREWQRRGRIQSWERISALQWPCACFLSFFLFFQSSGCM